MIIGALFQTSLFLAILLTTLTTGFILIFAIVVMPGIRKLANAEFLRAFQEIDSIVQNRQPIFGLVWAGSVLSLIIATVLGSTGFIDLAWSARALLIVATIIYLLGTQLTTVTVHLPLNNRIQSIDVASLQDAALQTERQNFESRWIRWNAIRTAFAALASTLLIVVMLLL